MSDTTDKKVKLVLGCTACPEAYEAYIGEEHVGYLRLRHGHFTVDCPDHGHDRVYEAYPLGDGMFETEERDRYLNDAAQAIWRWKHGAAAGPIRNQAMLDNEKPDVVVAAPGGRRDCGYGETCEGCGCEGY